MAPLPYKVIDLTYLHEVSMGDVDFQKEVTLQFLEVIDTDLAEMEKHLLEKDFNALRKDAHRTLSTIYIMGLNKLLESYLQDIDNQILIEDTIRHHFSIILNTCTLAKAEARLFLNSLNGS